MKTCASLFYLIILCSSLQAQDILRIKGIVIDDDTEEPLPFCNIIVDKLGSGTVTDMNGSYSLDFQKGSGDTLIANSMSYIDAKKYIDTSKSELRIDFRLKPQSFAMEAVEVVAGENPADIIMRKVLKAKKRNNPSELPAYEAELYSKVELDIDNIDESMKEAKLFNKVQFIFENIDTSSDVKPFLPVYVAEQIYDIYHKKGRSRRDVLKAQKVSGVNNQSVVDFINLMSDKFNVYDNTIRILEKEFISPLSSQAFAFYEYYLMDSAQVKGTWSYKIKFKPRRKAETTFYGDFWIAEGDWALLLLNMRMSPDVNINLVERVIVYADYERQDTLWLPKKEKLVIDFSSNDDDELMGIIGRTTASYKGYRLNAEDAAQRFKAADPEDIDFDAIEKEDAFWQENRHELLSKNESGVYEMIDSIQNVPIFKRASDLLYFLGSGFKPIGNIEIGPYWDMLYINEAEGYRAGLGVGTSNAFSRKLRLYGYAGYGFRDKRWKYRGIFQYVFNRHRWTEIGAYFHRDVSFENRSTESLPTQSLLSGVLRRNVPQKLFYSLEAKVYAQKTWKRGFSARLALMHRRLNPIGYEQVALGGMNFQFFPHLSEPNRIRETVTTSEVHLQLRWAYKERFLKGNFNQISIGSRYPIVSLQYTQGIKGVLASEYNYGRLQFNVRHWFHTSPLGWFEYDFEAGKIFSPEALPYLLLENSPGNEAYFYNKLAFNAMNSFEFVSDAYISLRMEQHLDGILFNRIPLLRKLKWREVLAFRGVWGLLSEQHRRANVQNHYDRNFRRHSDEGRDLSEGVYYGGFDAGPYMEASVGIENIFRFFRIDALWRLSYLDNRDARRFAIRLTMDFQF